MSKIDCAVLGLGGMGGTHVEAARESEYINRIVGYEPDAGRAKKRGDELGIDAVSDLQIILDDPSIKLAFIASVNEAHCEQAIECMRAGKAVLCEKPMGISLAEAQKMMEVQRETDAFFQVGFELRYSKLYMLAKEWIDAGMIGKPLSTDCTYFCSEFHGKNSWRSKSKGTLIGEKLSHYLDLPRWFVGDEVESVYSMHAPNFVPYFSHSDNHHISYRFRDGAVSTLNFVMGIAETDRGDPLLDLLDKQADDGHSLKYMICGLSGAIELDVFKRRIRRWKFSEGENRLESKIVETISFEKSEDQKWFHNTHGQNLRVAQLVAEGRKPDVPASDAYESMKLVFAAEQSEKERQIILMSDLCM